LKTQELQAEALKRTAEEPPAPPPPAAYYRPPAPQAPSVYFSPAPPPVGEGPAVPSYPAPEATPIIPTEPTTGEAMEPPRTSDWEEPESLEPEAPGRYLSIRQQHAIADTLRAHGRHLVTIESSYGDPVSREFADELAHAFSEADWLVGTITEHRGLPLASGVTVSAASFPPAPETRAMYEALLSAGIAVTQQLDPKQKSAETVVLVGTPL
jgi:hypothetical protein